MENNLMKSLICGYCSNRFEDPVILPCGETICKKDLRDLMKEDEENVIMCYFCGEQHRITKDSLPQNKVITKLMSETSMELENYKFLTYQRAKKLCMLLKHKVEHANKIERNPSDYLDVFFNQLIKQIDSSKDNCKHLIDKIHENMIKDLNLFRFECMCQCKIDFKPDFSDEEIIVSKLNEWQNILTGIDSNFGIPSDDSNIDYIEKEAHNLIKKVENRIQSLKEVLFLNVNCSFQPKDLNLDSDIFGKLVIEHPSTIKIEELN